LYLARLGRCDATAQLPAPMTPTRIFPKVPLLFMRASTLHKVKIRIGAVKVFLKKMKRRVAAPA